MSAAARLVCTSLLTLAMLAPAIGARPPFPSARRVPAASTAPAAEAAPGAAAGPPNGTYTYALSRNGGDQGTTTVVLYRRDDVREFELDEAGSAGAARMHVLAAYRYADLGVETYAATYQAPFLRGSPLGRRYKFRSEPDFYGQTTVRYRAARPGALVATIDGTPVSDVLRVPAEAARAVREPWILDAPFMAGALLLPALRHRSNEAQLAPVSEAFPPGTSVVEQRLVRATPSSPKTPKSDLAVDLPGVARVWFDPTTFVVHEVHFTGVNFDARLVSYVKGGFTGPFLAEPPPAAAAAAPHEPLAFSSADGTSLAGLLARPAAAAATGPAVVLVPPGPGAGVDYDGEGPTPMFPALAAALVQRGYAVLRYPMRGVGKSGGTLQGETWDQALADAQAALGALATDPGIDPKRIYLVGFGNGADIALAASAAGATASAVRAAGVVALGPTVLSYRACAAAVGAGASSSGAAWRKSALAHDPSALAARTRAAALVLHPGLPICGESKDQVDGYDDKLRAADPLATIVAATDLTQRFGSRYEAEAPLDTEELFPYRFDASTAGAIADWLDNPKSGSATTAPRGAPPAARSAPPPPPGVDTSGAGLPNPRGGTAVKPPAATRSVEPGVVLPSGVTPPPLVAPAPTATPVPTPRPQTTAATPAAAPATPGATPPATAATPVPAATDTATPAPAASPAPAQ